MMVVIGGLTCKLVSIQRLCHADYLSPSGIRIQCGRWESIHWNALAGYVPTDSKRGRRLINSRHHRRIIIRCRMLGALVHPRDTSDGMGRLWLLDRYVTPSSTLQDKELRSSPIRHATLDIGRCTLSSSAGR